MRRTSLAVLLSVLSSAAAADPLAAFAPLLAADDAPVPVVYVSAILISALLFSLVSLS